MSKTQEPQHETFILEYSEITPQIFLGSDLCSTQVCKLHGPEFEKLGITVEISLTAELKDTPTDNVEMYAWIPVVDKTAPSLNQLMQGSAIIHTTISRGGKVYLHCRIGHGRSPTMLAAYFIRFEKMQVHESIDRISEKRPEIHLEEVQIQALHEFSESLKNNT